MTTTEATESKIEIDSRATAPDEAAAIKTDPHRTEVERGERFEFGANWAAYLKKLDARRIRAAERSLQNMLKCERLDGKRFLDVGSGSGLFSLAASRLGAEVYSFDYDPQSVGCTQELRRRFPPDGRQWTVEQGSALDKDYLAKLGSFDIVYSWGVLHHTGSMWEALDNVCPLVKPGGELFIAIYDDRGGSSRRWRKLKKAYCSSSKPIRGLILSYALLRTWWKPTVVEALKGKPFHSWRHYGEGSARGMSAWRDVIDWVGGYPFEVAKPGEIIDFYHARGMALQKLVTSPGGCNEFVFRRVDSGQDKT